MEAIETCAGLPIVGRVIADRLPIWNIQWTCYIRSVIDIRIRIYC
jgi:hypothetical protein